MGGHTPEIRRVVVVPVIVSGAWPLKHKEWVMLHILVIFTLGVYQGVLMHDWLILRKQVKGKK